MIWCVEDDASIRDIEVYALQSTGFEAEGFSDGAQFWEAVQKERPELVVLDVMLPGIDGIELLRRMKARAELREIPVVMATAKGAEYDKIQGLDLGADYYLVKPFGVMELVSCVKAVLRRCGKAQGTLAAFDVVLDPAARRVTRSGTPLHLTPREFDLLEVLLRNRGIVLYREVLYERVWGLDAEYDSRTLDLHIQRLRKKLGWKNEIRTVFRVGYVLERGE